MAFEQLGPACQKAGRKVVEPSAMKRFVFSLKQLIQMMEIN